MKRKFKTVTVSNSININKTTNHLKQLNTLKTTRYGVIILYFSYPDNSAAMTCTCVSGINRLHYTILLYMFNCLRWLVIHINYTFNYNDVSKSFPKCMYLQFLRCICQWVHFISYKYI